jgi:YD repeat-containing protein
MLGVVNEDGWIYSFAYDPSHPMQKDTLPQDFTAVGKIAVTTAVSLVRTLRAASVFGMWLSRAQRFPQTTWMSIFESECDLFVCATYAKVGKERVRRSCLSRHRS